MNIGVSNRGASRPVACGLGCLLMAVVTASPDARVGDDVERVAGLLRQALEPYRSCQYTAVSGTNFTRLPKFEDRELAIHTEEVIIDRGRYRVDSKTKLVRAGRSCESKGAFDGETFWLLDWDGRLLFGTNNVGITAPAWPCLLFSFLHRESDVDEWRDVLKPEESLMQSLSSRNVTVRASGETVHLLFPAESSPSGSRCEVELDGRRAFLPVKCTMTRKTGHVVEIACGDFFTVQIGRAGKPSQVPSQVRSVIRDARGQVTGNHSYRLDRASFKLGPMVGDDAFRIAPTQHGAIYDRNSGTVVRRHAAPTLSAPTDNTTVVKKDYPANAARDALEGACTKAAAESKLVFMKSGFPECGWCRVFDRYHQTPEVKAILEKYFVIIAIDTKNMPDGKATFGNYAKPGAPSWVILGPNKAVLVDSYSPAGNVGYPLEPDETAHYLMALKKAAPAIAQQELDALAKHIRKTAGR